LLVDEGWQVNVKRVYRIWCREGLKVPKRQPNRGRLWLNDGSCVRLRPDRPNHVWSYDFVQDRTQDGRAFRMLTVIDEFTRRCLAIVVAGGLKSDDVLHCLTDFFIVHGPPEHVRSDNGPEFVARNVRQWLGNVGVTTLYIEPGSPWENGYCESFNSKLRDELLAGEMFSTLHEAKVLIEMSMIAVFSLPAWNARLTGAGLYLSCAMPIAAPRIPRGEYFIAAMAVRASSAVSMRGATFLVKRSVVARKPLRLLLSPQSVCTRYRKATF
jgi:transposase InsO family protein